MKRNKPPRAHRFVQRGLREAGREHREIINNQFSRAQRGGKNQSARSKMTMQNPK
jgi:hypothetical protein